MADRFFFLTAWLNSVRVNTMNKHLFELLRRIEDSARRLAATIMHDNDKRLRDIALVEVEIKEISNALEAFKNEVTSGALAGHYPAG
jgi:phosphohistidine phosphatase SixA